MENQQVGYRIKEILGAELSSPRTQTIGGTSVSIASARDRKVISVRNNSTGGQVITICPSNFAAAVAGTGIVLNVNDVWTDSSGDNYDCWTGNVNAIASAAGGTIAVFER